MRFSDLSYQEAIRRYFAGHVSATHLFAPAEVRTALAQASGGSLTITDLLGDRVTLAANDELVIDVDRPGHIRVVFPRERFADQAAARAAVEQQGGQVIEEPSDAPDPKSFELVVTFRPSGATRPCRPWVKWTGGCTSGPHTAHTKPASLTWPRGPTPSWQGPRAPSRRLSRLPRFKASAPWLRCRSPTTRSFSSKANGHASM